MLIHTEKKDGFTIKFYALPADDRISDSFMPEDVAEISSKIESGEYVHFLAHVTAEKKGIVLGEDYLGSCVYESYMQFVEHNDYYADMVNEAVEEAKQTISKLCADN